MATKIGDAWQNKFRQFRISSDFAYESSIKFVYILLLRDNCLAIISIRIVRQAKGGWSRVEIM